MNKRCSGSYGRLRYVPDKCRKCTGEIRPLEGLPSESVVVSNESLEVVNKFCYLGDMISAVGVEESIVARIRCDWVKCMTLLPRYFHCAQKVKVFRHLSGVKLGSERRGFGKLVTNDMMMVQWMCNV